MTFLFVEKYFDFLIYKNIYYGKQKKIISLLIIVSIKTSQQEMRKCLKCYLCDNFP